MLASAAELVVVLTAKDLASNTLRSFGQQLGGMGGLAKVATAGLAAVGAAGVGLATGLVSSVNAAMDFESAMSAVASVAGGTDADLDRLAATALALGQDTTLAGVSATDAALAMRELAAAGLSVDEIMNGAALGALRLASAGGLDVGRAAEIAAMALANFGLEGDKAAGVADLFAAAANSSAISVDDIAEAMKYIGPVANSMGLSIEEVTATIAALGNEGIKGSQAGTALRSMLVSLAKPSEKAADLIRDLGLEFFDTEGRMKSIAGISEELKTGLSGLTDQQRAAALATLFGNEALTAATVLYGEGAAGIAQWLDEVTNGATAAQVGAMRNNNLKGSLEALKSSFETAQIALGTAFLPALKQLADLATDAVNASIPLIQAWGPRLAAALAAGLGALPGLVERAATAVGSLVAAFRALAAGDINGMFGPILAAIEAAFGPDAMARAAGGVNTFLTVLEQLRGVLTTAREAFAALPTPVQQLAAGFLALGPAVRVAAVVVPLLLGALTGLGPIVGFLTSTIPVLGAVIGALGAPLTIAIAAVAALGVAWATNWLGIRDQTMPIITQIVGFVTGTLIPGLMQLGTYVATVLWPQMQLAWTQIQATIAAAVAAVLPTLQAFAAWFSADLLPAVQQAAATVVPAMIQIGDATIAAFQAALPGIQAFASGMQQLGAAVLPVLVSVAATIQGTLGPAVVAIATWAAEVIPQFAAAWTNVMSVVGPIIGQLASLIGTALAGIAGFVEAHSARIKGILEGAWQAMSSAIGAVLTIITGLISTALLVIAGDWEGAWQRLQTTATTAWGQIQSAIDGAIQAVVNIIAIGLLSAQAAATSAFENIRAAIATKIEEAKVAVQTGVGQIPGIVLAVGGALFSAGAAIIGQLVAGIRSRIGEAIQIVRDGIQQIADLLPGSEPKDSSSPLARLGLRGAAIFGNLAEGMRDATPEATQAAAGVAQAVANAVTATLGGLKALAEFDFAGGSPSGETMGWFRHLMESLVRNLAAAAQLIGTEGLDAAKKVGESAGQVGSAVKSTLEGFKALAEYDFTKGSPTGEAMGWFRHLMESIVLNFAQAATLVGTEGMTKAKDFADSVAKVVGAAAGALKLFEELLAVKDVPGKVLAELHQQLEVALDYGRALFARAEAIKADALAFLTSMQQAFAAFQQGMALSNQMGGAPLATAPLGVGGGNGGTGGTPGGLGGAPIYNVTVAGDVYDGARFEDRVIDALTVAERRGRY